MKVIRAKRQIFVPINPESPERSSMRLVQTGLVALVPSDYVLPADYYVDVCTLGEEPKTRKKREQKEV